MTKISKFPAAVFSVIALGAIVYTLLMLRYRTPLPSDLRYLICGNDWQVDSAVVQRRLLILLPEDEPALTRADSIMEVRVTLFGRNNIHKLLSIRAVELHDSSLGFTANIPIYLLCPPTLPTKKDPEFFLNEPFGIIYLPLQTPDHMDEHQFNNIVERAFQTRTLTAIVHTNRGDIETRLGGYTTEYPPE